VEQVVYITAPTVTKYQFDQFSTEISFTQVAVNNKETLIQRGQPRTAKKPHGHQHPQWAIGPSGRVQPRTRDPSDRPTDRRRSLRQGPIGFPSAWPLRKWLVRQSVCSGLTITLPTGR